MDRLGRREIGMQPQFVTGLKVGYGGDWQGFAGAGYMNLNFGASEVEARRGLRVE